MFSGDMKYLFYLCILLSGGYLSRMLKHNFKVVITLTSRLYMGGLWLKSWPGDQLSWGGSWLSSGKCWNRDHNCFLSCPFQSIIHSHSTILHWITYIDETELLNDPRINQPIWTKLHLTGKCLTASILLEYELNDRGLSSVTFSSCEDI